MFELGSLGIQIADSILHFNPFLKAANKDESEIVEFISGFVFFFFFFLRVLPFHSQKYISQYVLPRS